MGQAHLHSEMLFPARFCRHQKKAVNGSQNVKKKAITIIWGLANNEQHIQTTRSKN